MEYQYPEPREGVFIPDDRDLKAIAFLRQALQLEGDNKQLIKQAITMLEKGHI